MSQDQNAETTETWQVAIAPNNVQTMTLDQLDAAYEQGVITEQTLVWTDGMEQWLPLAEVAGGEEEEAAAAPPAAEPTAPAVAPAPAAAASSIPVAPAPVAAAPVAAAPAAQAGSFPPAGIAQPSAVPGPVGTIGAPQGPASTAPVAMSLEGLDLDSLAMPKSGGGKSKMIFAAVAALGVIGAGFAIAGGGGGEEAAASAAAAAQPMAEDGTPVFAKNDPNAPLAMDGVGSYQVSKKEEKQFAEQAKKEAEMKAKAAELAEAAKEAKEEAEAKKGGAKVRRTSYKRPAKSKSSSKKSGGGGSAFDPLNSSLP
jgi:hypothetical protein